MSFASLAQDLPDDPLFEPVVAEVDEDDNPLISTMKRECSKDQLEYCAGKPYKSGEHTMCRYCVSNFAANIGLDKGHATIWIKKCTNYL